jgi:hypothetical protein
MNSLVPRLAASQAVWCGFILESVFTFVPERGSGSFGVPFGFHYVAGYLSHLVQLSEPDVTDNLTSGLGDGVRRPVDQVVTAFRKCHELSPRGQSGQIGLKLHPNIAIFGWQSSVFPAEHDQWTVAEIPRGSRLGGTSLPRSDFLQERGTRFSGPGQAPDRVPFRGRDPFR